MILNFQLVTGEAKEEEKTGEEEIEEVEEFTMLNIMPYLRIPKREFIRYSIIQKFEYLDNYYLSKGDREDRFVSITSPSVSIRYPMQRFYLEGGYTYAFTYYTEDDEQLHAHNANIKLYHRPTRRFSIGLTDEFLRNDRAEQEEDIDVKVPGKTFNRNNLRAEAKYEISRRLRCGAQGSLSFTDFEERTTGALPNKTEFGSSGNIEYVIDKRTTAGVVYNFYTTLFEESDEKDSYKHTTHLTYSHRVLKAFTVNAHGGYDFISYESGEDVFGVSGGADLSFDISRLTKFTLGYNYKFEDSSREDYLVHRTHGFQARLRHNLTPRFVIGAVSFYNIWLYDSEHDISTTSAKSDKRSDVIGFGCDLNYKLTKIIDITATYNMNTKISDFSDDEYLSNHYLLTVRAAF